MLNLEMRKVNLATSLSRRLQIPTTYPAAAVGKTALAENTDKTVNNILSFHFLTIVYIQLSSM